MMLNVHLPGAASYDVGDEIWQEPIADAIRTEAEMIADQAGPDLLESVSGDRGALRDRIVAEMSAALVNVGDSHRAPDGVLYTLTDEPADERRDPAKVRRGEPVVTEVLRFEDLAPGSLGSRRAVVRWSDGSESEGLRWYSDEVLSPADHVGRQ